MNLKEVLDKKLILLNEKFNSKEEVLKYIAFTLQQNGYITSQEELLNTLFDREYQTSTAIGHKIAIPHARSATVVKPIVVILRNQSDIVWDTQSNATVDFVFLFATGVDESELKEYITMLSLVFSKIVNKELIDKMKYINDQEEMINLLCY